MFRTERMKWTRKGEKKNDIGNKGANEGNVECRRMNGWGWEPKNQDIISKRARTKTVGGGGDFREPTFIHFFSGTPYPVLRHPTHKMSSTHLHSFVNIQKYCFPFTETTILCLKETTAWGANFLAKGDRKVSACEAIRFLSSGESSKYRNVKAGEEWNELA
jgi:hypothetical protein